MAKWYFRMKAQTTL